MKLFSNIFKKYLCKTYVELLQNTYNIDYFILTKYETQKLLLTPPHHCRFMEYVLHYGHNNKKKWYKHFSRKNWGQRADIGDPGPRVDKSKENLIRTEVLATLHLPLAWFCFMTISDIQSLWKCMLQVL